MVDPVIWTDSDFQKLPVNARLLFIGHISAADDEGRGDLSEGDFKQLTFPQDGDVDETEIGRLMAVLASAKRKPKLPFVVYYLDGRGARVWSLPNWGKYQSIDRPRPSRIPPPGSSIAKKQAGAMIRPAQADLLLVMAKERGVDLGDFLLEQGIDGLDAVLARQVTGLKMKLEEIKPRNGKAAADDRVKSVVAVVKIASQRREWSLVESELLQVPSSLWPKVRAGIRGLDSRIEGSSPAEVRASLKEVFS